MGAVTYLRRKADQYRPLAEEHCEGHDDPQWLAYFTIELALRELAEALEHDQAEAA